HAISLGQGHGDLRLRQAPHHSLPSNEVPPRGRMDRVKPWIRWWPASRSWTTHVRLARPLLLIASCGGLTPTTLRLALLAPDLVEEILAGRADPPNLLMLDRLERALPASWEEQRRWLPGSCDKLP
ncbi:MAG: hypothetical protein K0S78_4556, partial [Thermomicrobiales bacterium]|nr:hypothetical protein [Thermomicrobiales bacterium]